MIVLITDRFISNIFERYLFVSIVCTIRHVRIGFCLEIFWPILAQVQVRTKALGFLLYNIQ